MTTAVAVALYNGERFLKEQLDSLRNQTVSPDQVVFCDDGSKDGTVALVKAYIEKHGLQDRWFLYENEENLGYIKNFYHAVSLCNADLIFLSDQDDVWREDKIEKMCSVMAANENIKLLCCRYGIIDAAGEEQRSFVEPKANQDGGLEPVAIEQVMRAYRWPGMLMCLRRDFFSERIARVYECKVAHDFMLISLACDVDGFYEYHYVGAYHRRHENNTAREEHRVSKLLNLPRKLQDISVYRSLLENYLSFNVPVDEKIKKNIADRLDLVIKREKALKEKSLRQIVRLYRSNTGNYLRLKSFVCDFWLVLFGRK